MAPKSDSTRPTPATKKAAPRRSPGDGSVYYDKSKDCWIASVTIDGTRRKRSAANETDAKKLLRVLNAQIDNQTTVNNGNMTVSAVLDDWVKLGLSKRSIDGRPLAPSTAQNHQWLVDEWKRLIGSKRLAKLTIKDVEAGLATMAESSFGLWSLRKARSTLSLALKHAVKHGMVSHNVALLAELPADARRPVARRAMTVDQVVTFVEAVRGHPLEAMFLIMVTVGPRPGEAAGLTWDEVDLTAGRLRFSQARRVSRGERPQLVSDLKTSGSKRTVDLPDFVFESLRLHRAQQIRQRDAADKWADDRLVFATANGTIYRPENVRRTLATVTKRAGLGVWSPNELRHTAASLLVDDGVSLQKIAELLGHRDTRMLERTYSHKIRESVDTAKAMNTILAAPKARRSVVVRRKAK